MCARLGACCSCQQGTLLSRQLGLRLLLPSCCTMRASRRLLAPRRPGASRASRCVPRDRLHRATYQSGVTAHILGLAAAAAQHLQLLTSGLTSFCMRRPRGSSQLHLRQQLQGSPALPDGRQQLQPSLVLQQSRPSRQQQLSSQSTELTATAPAHLDSSAQQRPVPRSSSSKLRHRRLLHSCWSRKRLRARHARLQRPRRSGRSSARRCEGYCEGPDMWPAST